MTASTHVVRNGDSATFADVAVDNLTVNGNTVAGGLLLGTSEVVDLNGEADALIMDAAQNVRLDGSSTGKLRIKISGAYDFEALANIFRMLSGSVLETNTINETTAASGVTIDGVLCKDSVVTGGLIGNVTGNIAGTLSGGQKDVPVAITGDGAITVAPSSVFLSKAGAAAITIVAPTVTTHDGYIIRVVAISAQAHVITSGVVGFNAKGSSGTLTFGGAIGDSVTLIAYQGNWYTLAKVNVTAA
jgi:hypothetical protein